RSEHPRTGSGAAVSGPDFHARQTRYAEKNGTRNPCEYCGSFTHLSANTRSIGKYAQPSSPARAASCHGTSRNPGAAAGGYGAEAGARGVTRIDIPVPEVSGSSRTGPSVGGRPVRWGLLRRGEAGVKPRLTAAGGPR